MNQFRGKTVVITGAAGGIGRELASHFAELGARIGAIDKNPTVKPLARTMRTNGVQTCGLVADISDGDAIKDAFEKIRTELGPVDVLINNAGFSSARSLETTDTKSWTTDIGDNLNGPFHCTSQALIHMKQLGGGAIVNIGSVNGLSSLGDPAYSAAKAGMISYTKAVALEYGRFNIRCNIICPGTVKTPIWQDRVEKKPEILEQLVKWYPLRRVADPADIASVAVFLASDAARAITGAMLPVDCGLSAGNIVMSRELTLQEF